MCVFAKHLNVFWECFIKIHHLLPQKAQTKAQWTSHFAHFIKEKSSLHILGTMNRFRIIQYESQSYNWILWTNTPNTILKNVAGFLVFKLEFWFYVFHIVELVEVNCVSPPVQFYSWHLSTLQITGREVKRETSCSRSNNVQATMVACEFLKNVSRLHSVME